jgi:hypothetical protein
MNAARLLPVNNDTLLALGAHLREKGSDISLVDAVALAIRAWLADNGGVLATTERSRSPDADSNFASRGYQWKELFLPDGTELRMRFDDEVHHARVSGDAIVYRGLRISPRQMTLAIAGDGRNAWRDLSLRLPGDDHFRPACVLRRMAKTKQFETAPVARDESPAATIAAAAASMSDALRAALVLVQHTKAQAVPKFERRVDKHRRGADVLTDHAMFD